MFFSNRPHNCYIFLCFETCCSMCPTSKVCVLYDNNPWSPVLFPSPSTTLCPLPLRLAGKTWTPHRRTPARGTAPTRGDASCKTPERTCRGWPPRSGTRANNTARRGKWPASTRPCPLSGRRLHRSLCRNTSAEIWSDPDSAEDAKYLTGAKQNISSHSAGLWRRSSTSACTTARCGLTARCASVCGSAPTGAAPCRSTV